METERLKECLAINYLRLRDRAEGDLAAQVPSCPEWTLADLIKHVAHVYLHKVETMRHNSWPDPWPPPPTGETPAEMLERGYRELEAEFSARPATEKAFTWYEPDPTVAFWLRRMTHETVVHRWDAELASGVSSEPVPNDLALDGIDELLVIFLAWASTKWPEDFVAELPQGAGGGSVGVSTAGGRWRVSWEPTGLVSTTAGDDAPADAEISALPEAMMRWLWRRSDGPLTVSGDEAKVAQLRKLLGAATQ